MGILNATPDSFSDGGKFQILEAAVNRAEQMIAEGVDIIDIGGESSRPGAEPVPLEEELRRVLPLVHALRGCGKPISVDTYKPEVMRAALDAGADMINDITALRRPGALEAVSESGCGLCLMHMQNDPVSMQERPEYRDPVAEVRTFLQERIDVLEHAGVARNRIVIDPGFGFGKTLEHNRILLKHLGRVQTGLATPLLVGVSRKSMIAGLSGRSQGSRLAGSLAAALAAVAQGAFIVRVHDVAETVEALNVWQAIQQ